MTAVAQQQPRLVVQRDERYYVSVIDGPHKGLLLGPYDTHEQALDNVGRGRDLANGTDCRAAFYSFGTCSAPVNHPLKTAFGR